MGGWRGGQMRWMAGLLTALGALLLVAGALIGWLLPRLAISLPPLDAAHTLLAFAHLDVSGFLGADITALAVIIAVVIGFNATTLQIAGQTHSLALVRAILLSLTPFLLCWTLTSGVALAYFLLPPVYVAQLWQALLWFGAVVVLMIAYLWDLPWRLSGQYVGLWAVRGLARLPIARWEALDGYSTLQTAVAAASVRGDLGTVRAITTLLGRFLTSVRDPKAETENAYDRRRYRALKGLLSGCAQNAAPAPNAVSYDLGFVLAGTLLQGVAIGLPMDDPTHDLFTGIFGALRTAPQRLNALWTGMRHALCRGFEGKEDPYLLQFWQARTRWTLDDPRRIAKIGEGIGRMHAGCWQLLRATGERAAADAEAAELAVDLYRDLATHFGPRLTHERHTIGPVRVADLAVGILDTSHAAILRAWPNGEAEPHRVAVVNAYERRRAELLAVLKAG
jgi:hypothetical protein